MQTVSNRGAPPLYPSCIDTPGNMTGHNCCCAARSGSLLTGIQLLDTSTTSPGCSYTPLTPRTWPNRKRTALPYQKSCKTCSTWGESQSRSGFGRPAFSPLPKAKRCFVSGGTATLSTPRLYLVILHVSVGSIFQQH